MKKIFLILVMAVISISLHAQEPFSKSYKYIFGPYGGVWVQKVIQAGSGDYLISGVILVGNVGMTNYVLLMTDRYGNLKWMKEIDTPDWWALSNESDIIQTKDNGFLFSGNSPLANSGILIKYDSSWKKVWEKGFTNSYMINTLDRMTEDHSGEIFTYGSVFTYYPNSEINTQDLWIMHLDEDGQILNQATIGTVDYEETPTEFVRLSSGEFLVSGRRSHISSPYTNNEFLMKLNSSFEPAWGKMLVPDTLQYYRIADIEESSDGNILVTGNIITESYDPMPFILKIDQNNGNPIWTKQYVLGDDSGINVQFSDIVSNEEDLLTGTGSAIDSVTRMLLFTADEYGDIIWAKRHEVVTPGLFYNSSGVSILKSVSGGNAVAGGWSLLQPGFLLGGGIQFIEMNNDGSTLCPFPEVTLRAEAAPFNLVDFPAYSQSGLVEAKDTSYFSEGYFYPDSYYDCLATNIPGKSPEQNMITAPNPTNGNFTVTISDLKSQCTLRMFNSSGQEVYRVSSLDPLDLKAGWDISIQSSPGVYFLELVAGEMRITRKIIII